MRGSHFRDAMDKIFLARRLFGLRDNRSRLCHITLGQLHASQKEFADNEAVNDAIILLGQVEALAPMSLGASQVVPFVEHAGQAKMGIIDNLQRLIPGQLQDMLEGLGG